MNLNRLILLTAFFVILTGCTHRYSREELAPWMESVDALKGGVDPNRMTSGSLAVMIAPAFNDEVFVPVFGKPFDQLSERERRGIRDSLIEACPQPWVGLGLAVPFEGDDHLNPDRKKWLACIERAQNESFEATLERRRGRAESRKLAAKERAKRGPYRQPKVQSRESEVDWTGLAGALAGLFLLDRELSKASEPQRSSQATADGRSWFELTDGATISRAKSLYPYSLMYDFEYDELFEMLEKYPWNQATYNLTQRLRSRLNQDLFETPDHMMTDFHNADRALKLILQTPLPN